MEVACILGGCVEERRLGHVVIGSGVITQRDPDTVRGPDVWFIGYDKFPAGPLPDEYLDLPPDLIVAVFEPADHWSAMLGRAVEYMDAGVPAVCIVDPQDQAVTVCRPESHPVTLAEDDELTFPDILPGFSVPVRTFFE
jgi:Uma2 family endonuclease